MKPVKAELDALREVLFTPLEEFGSEENEDLAYKRMFTAAIEAVDHARAERGHFAVMAWFGGPVYMGIGPYSTANQANKDFEAKVKPLGPKKFAIVRMTTPEGLAKLLEKTDTPA